VCGVPARKAWLPALSGTSRITAQGASILAATLPPHSAADMKVIEIFSDKFVKYFSPVNSRLIIP
jgi:hypothetical protein